MKHKKRHKNSGTRPSFLELIMNVAKKRNMEKHMKINMQMAVVHARKMHVSKMQMT